MADKMTIMRKWLTDIREDENLGDISEQEMAYIIYAAVIYGLDGEKVNIGDTFGGEFKYLNWAMSNIYGQIDNIQGYVSNMSAAKVKLDSEAIKNLRLEGKTGKEICIELGYPLEKEKSLSSNAGWKEAAVILKQRAEAEAIQKSVLSVNSVTESVKSGTDLAGTENTDVTENTESVQSVQKSIQKTFDF